MKNIFKSFRKHSSKTSMSEKSMSDSTSMSGDSMTSTQPSSMEVPRSGGDAPMMNADNNTMSMDDDKMMASATIQPLTVLELFQSQGCSSCPPANTNVLRLIDSDPNLLILTYEVTYWDHLGWTDTFGRSAHDDRQRQYVRALKKRSAYTPQCIVNGRVDGVGSNSKDLDSLIKKGTEVTPTNVIVKVSADQVTVNGSQGGLVQMVRYDPRTHNVSIPRGENAGRNIPHRNVVKDVTQLGSWRGGSQTFSLPKKGKDGLEAAILVQAVPGGPVIGAARV
ncbi:MAG: hypothetical protein Q9187_002338 [Circinaria calcarea]